MGTLARDALKIVVCPVIVLVINFVLSYFTNVYFTVSWFDNLMHGLGGISIGIAAITIVVIASRRHYICHIHWLVSLLFAISFTALAAVTWEFYEFSSDALANTEYQIALSDTMADMAFGLLGGIFGALCVLLFRYRDID